MGLFENMRRRREMDRLEEEARTRPGPQSLAALAEKYLAYGDETKALSIAKEASAKYPDSERVHSTYQFIMRTHLQSRLRDLIRKVAQKPTPQDYAALASIYFMDLGDRDAALETCRRGSMQFPQDENLHMIDGQIRFDRFHQEYLSKDGMRAVEHLERAASLNKNNYKALALLARLFVEIGALGRGRVALEQVVRLAPEDDRSRELLARVKTAAPTAAPESDLEGLFLEVEKRGSLTREARAMVMGEAGRPATERKVHLDEARVGDLLSRFDAIEGVRGSVVMSQRGEIISARVSPGAVGQALPEAARMIYETAEESSRRMDIGSFMRASIEGPVGKFHVVEMKSLVLAVLAAPQARHDQVSGAIEQVLDALAAGAVGTV